LDVAPAATACSTDEANAGLGESIVIGISEGGGGVRTPVEALPLNMASIVGRKAAPNGVERKSDGRSVRVFLEWYSTEGGN
jgi:hypothetical protein